jgi:hypothetical protein
MEVCNTTVVGIVASTKAGQSRAILKRIRLELARSAKFQYGSFRHGYEFIAPLDVNRHIDFPQWKKLREHCRVRRFWADEQDEIGWLVHKPGGEEHAFWAFDYDPNSTDDDEPGYRFGAHAFVPGEYVAIKCHDGEQHTLRVVSVTDLR